MNKNNVFFLVSWYLVLLRILQTFFRTPIIIIAKIIQNIIITVIIVVVFVSISSDTDESDTIAYIQGKGGLLFFLGAMGIFGAVSSSMFGVIPFFGTFLRDRKSVV